MNADRSSRFKAAYVGVAGVDTWLSGRSGPLAKRARFLTKPLLMPTLAASVLADPRAGSSPLRVSTLAGLTASWAGDLALLGDGTRAFLAGAGAFGVGHVAYLSGLWAQRNPESAWRASAPRSIVAVSTLTVPVIALAVVRESPKLAPPVLGYAALLALLAARATHLDPQLPTRARRSTAAGAVLFLVSDTVLATRKFVLCDPPAWTERVVMGTYTAAQYLLADGAAHA